MGHSLLALFGAYLMGSIPTALWISRYVAHVDIRAIGDGNMGARNVYRTLGFLPALTVAAVDISKGIAAVLFSRGLELSLGWQMAAGICVVLGHDFSLFAGLRGGQGFATTLGVLLALVPAETLPGLAVYGLLYLITHKSDLSAGVGMGLLATLVWLWESSMVLLFYVIILFLSIPAKKLLDTPRRRRITSRTA